MKTREKILEKSLELFNTRGFNEVGVREIARALKISPGNLSYHFPKKEDIFFELLLQYSKKNTVYYESYFAGEDTLENFIVLMMSILKSQYKYRGIFLASTLIIQEIKNQDRTNYKDRVQERIKTITVIFEHLAANKQIKADESAISFLVSFISLFGRFSILEAFFMHKQREEKEIVYYYMTMLSKQLSLFATRKGKASIRSFHLHYLQ